MSFADHFSPIAANYAVARPAYPAELFQWLASVAPSRTLAWDAGTGNGQAAVALAAHFERVVATDASRDQVVQARVHPRVEFRVALAEDGPGPGAHSVSLVTVAQALHWFDRPRFYRAVRAVTVPGAVVAAWCYGLAEVSSAIDALIEDFYMHTVGPYWPAERRWIEERYETLEFPFARVAAPSFVMRHRWSGAEIVAYLRTWSAVQRYQQARQEDPLIAFAPRLLAAWGGAGAQREVRWPLYLRAGRIH